MDSNIGEINRIPGQLKLSYF